MMIPHFLLVADQNFVQLSQRDGILMVFLPFDEEEDYCPYLHHQHDKMRKTKMMMIMMIRCRQPLLNPLTLSCLRPPAKPSLCCHKFFTYLFPPTLVSISFSGLHAFYYLHLSSFSPTERRFVDICCILFITFILHISFYSRQSVVLIFRDFWSFNLFTCQLY